MKKFVLGLLIVVVVTGLIFSGCAKPAPTPTPAPVPAPTPEKPIELKFSSWANPVDKTNTDVFQPWCDKVQEATNGRVQITLFPAEALGKASDSYDMVISDIADIAWVVQYQQARPFPLSDAVCLPFIFDSGYAGAAAYWELTEKYLLDTEYQEVKLLWAHCAGLFDFGMATKQIKTLEDFEGQRIWTNIPVCVEALTTLGGVGTFLPPPEVYTSLERGIIDGYTGPPTAASGFKWMELTKYRTRADFFEPVSTVMMNLDVWNNLPPDIKQIMDGLTGLEQSKLSGSTMDNANKVCYDTVISPYDKSKGNPPMYYVPEDEKAKWREVVAPIYQKYIDDNEAKGLPAREFYNDMLQLAKKYAGKG